MKLVTTNDAAPPVEIPAGTSTSADPIEGGSCIINAAVPPGEDGHTIWRTLSGEEKAEAKVRAREGLARAEQERVNRVRAEKHGLLRRTMHLVAPDEPQTDAWAAWRQKIREIPDTADPDDLQIPEPPAEIPSEAGHRDCPEGARPQA